MTDREDVIVFDDGSIESKTLTYELDKTGLYDIHVISVNSNYDDLQKWITEKYMVS